jgi:Ca2+/Na+ antiporter
MTTATNTMHKAQPLPDISKWSNGFTGWAILDKFVETGKPDPKLGILITETQIAAKRIFGWAFILLLFAMLPIILAIADPAESIVFIVMAAILLGAALYRIFTWYVNRDLQVRIFRQGFTLRKGGKTQIVLWSEVDYVKERWQKTVYQGIIHIKTHKIEIFKKNGEKLELNRSFDRIEEIGHLIQLAVADHLLAASVDKLRNNQTCDFGSFMINPYGLTHKDKNFLPWNEVHSLNVHSMGQTTIQIQKVNSNKRGTSWASENGGTLKNLHLFLTLAYWFIQSAHQPETASETEANMDTGDVYYHLLLTKKEAQQGMQKAFHIGMPQQEKQLIVKIPPGVQPGTLYRFPDFGRPVGTGNGATGTLTVEVLVEKVTSLQQRWQEFQLIGGGIALMFGMIWLGFWSTLDLFSTILYALLIGTLCGWTMSIGRRFIGAVSGAIGGVICVILQILYYTIMYFKFGRESFWDIESVILVFIAAVPGIGLYMLLKKIFEKNGNSMLTK